LFLYFVSFWGLVCALIAFLEVWMYLNQKAKKDHCSCFLCRSFAKKKKFSLVKENEKSKPKKQNGLPESVQKVNK